MRYLHQDLQYFFSGLVTFLLEFLSFDTNVQNYFQTCRGSFCHYHHIDKCILLYKKISTPVFIQILLKLKNSISSCLSTFSTSVGEVSYLESLRRLVMCTVDQKKVKKDGFRKNYNVNFNPSPSSL